VWRGAVGAGTRPTTAPEVPPVAWGSGRPAPRVGYGFGLSNQPGPGALGSNVTRYRLNCPDYHDLKIPADFEPQGLFRSDAIRALWYPFYDHAGDAAAVDGFDLSKVFFNRTGRDVDGLFFKHYMDGTLGERNDEDLNGRRERVVRWALGYLARFSDLIPNEGSCCPNARDKVQKRMRNNGFQVEIAYTGSCSGETAVGDSKLMASAQQCGASRLPNRISASLRAFQSGKYVVLCERYVDALSFASDRMMHEAWLAWTYLQPGQRPALSPPINAAHYQAGAEKAARVAAGAVLSVGRTILHELLHILYGGHCANGCCMQRLAFKWMCSTAAVNGAYTLDDENADPMGLGLNFRYNSLCHDAGDAAGIREFFKGGCMMTRPGSTSSAMEGTGWRKTRQKCTGTACATAAWVNPTACPSC